MHVPEVLVADHDFRHTFADGCLGRMGSDAGRRALPHRRIRRLAGLHGAEWGRSVRGPVGVDGPSGSLFGPAELSFGGARTQGISGRANGRRLKIARSILLAGKNSRVGERARVWYRATYGTIQVLVRHHLTGPCRRPAAVRLFLATSCGTGRRGTKHRPDRQASCDHQAVCVSDIRRRCPARCLRQTGRIDLSAVLQSVPRGRASKLYRACISSMPEPFYLDRPCPRQRLAPLNVQEILTNGNAPFRRGRDDSLVASSSDRTLRRDHVARAGRRVNGRRGRA